MQDAMTVLTDHTVHWPYCVSLTKRDWCFDPNRTKTIWPNARQYWQKIKIPAFFPIWMELYLDLGCCTVACSQLVCCNNVRLRAQQSISLMCKWLRSQKSWKKNQKPWTFQWNFYYFKMMSKLCEKKQMKPSTADICAITVVILCCSHGESIF